MTTKARVVRIGAPKRPDVAPRRIPTVMRWATRLHNLPAQIAWLLALGGVIGALFVVPRIRLDPPVMKTAGTATIVARGDETVIYDLTVDGKTYRRAGLYYGTLTTGNPLKVWYDPRDPEQSTTFADTPDNDYGKGSLLVLLFPGGALIVAALAMWQRRRFRLLRYGQAVEARLREADPTEGGRVAYLTYRYVVDGTTHSLQLTSVRRDDGRDSETVLYNPANPHHALALSDLTGAPRLEGTRFVATKIPHMVFALPLLTLATIGILVAKTLR